MPLIFPHVFANGTYASAPEIMENFYTVADLLNIPMGLDFLQKGKTTQYLSFQANVTWVLPLDNTAFSNMWTVRVTGTPMKLSGIKAAIIVMTGSLTLSLYRDTGAGYIQIGTLVLGPGHAEGNFVFPAGTEAAIGDKLQLRQESVVYTDWLFCFLDIQYEAEML